VTNLKVSIKPFSSTQSVYKTAEVSGGLPETEQLSSHSVPRQYANATSGQGPITISDPTDTGLQAPAGPTTCISEGNSKVCGHTTVTIRAIPLAPSLYRAFQSLMNLVLSLEDIQEEISTKYEIVVSLTPANKADLEWWIALKKAPLEH